MSLVEHRKSDGNPPQTSRGRWIPQLGSFKTHCSRLCDSLNNIGSMILAVDPRGPAAGRARSLLSLGTFLTMIATPRDQLFFRSASYPNGVVCGDLANGISLYCIFDRESPLPYVISFAILLAVILGVLPMVTSWLHAWLAWSFVHSVPIIDGGDQVAQALTLLFIIFHFGDMRLTHWHTESTFVRIDTFFSPVRAGAVFLFEIQASVIYLHASIAKFAVPEWANGTAIWYWMQDPTFAPPRWIYIPLNALLSYVPSALLITYGVLAFEFVLGVAILLRASLRCRLLLPGLLLHLGFAMVFGLWSFLCSMAALLIMYTHVSASYRMEGKAQCSGHLAS